MADYDFGAAFARIEEELIDGMMRNLQTYHLDWEDAEGFDWTQWQVEQLRNLEEYRRTNQERFGPQFESINALLEEAIRHGYDNGQKAEELSILQALASNRSLQRSLPSGSIGTSFFRINDRKLEALLNATRSDIQRAEWAVLRRANDQYRKIIFNAQVYANTGAGTVEKAVDMATKDFLMRGIDCIEYSNGARHTIQDYADMAIRTAERRAYLYGEGQKRQEWGVSLVIVNKRSGHPCPQCAKWCGKILIDDVYSGGRPDGKHTLLSDAMAQGFLHPRCKDGFTTYFPGITTVPDPATKGELQEAEKAEAEEARQQLAERMAERWGRRAKYSLDPADERAAEARAAEWRSVLTSGEDSGILQSSKVPVHRVSRYEPDIQIPFGVGAKAKDIFIELPDGTRVPLTPGTRITNVEPIAGAKRNRKIDEIDILLERYPGTDADKWQKKKGVGFVEYRGESYKANIHWYEEPSVGRVKYKVKPDADGNWFYDD